MPQIARPTSLALLLFAACAQNAGDKTSAGDANLAGNANAATSGVGPAAGNANVQAAAPVPTPVCTPTGGALTVTVDASKGPLGQSSPRAITNKLWSVNLDDLNPVDYTPSLDANFVAYLKAIKPALLRWPAGYDSQTYQFSATASGNQILTPAFIDKFMALCQAVGAEPLIGINTLTGSADNAAQLVQFLNKTRGYNVRYFHIGNEPDVDPDDTTVTPATYVSKFAAFKTAMQAVDPNIKLVGAEITTGARVLGISGQKDWLTPILQGTQGAPMDAVAWHYYPKDSSQTLAGSSAVATPNNLLIETASDWPPAGMDFANTIIPKMRAVMATYAPKAEIWIDELAEDSGKANGQGTADRAVGALWLTDVLGRYAEQGADAAFRFIFKTGGNHGYALLDPNNQPRPDYYAHWLYAQQFGDAMVSSSTTDVTQVAVHAATRKDDGSLRVFLVNKTTASKTVRLKLTGYAPTTAARYQLVGAALDANVMTLNGQSFTPASLANGANAIAAVATTDACTDNVVTLPAVSVTLLNFGTAK